MGVMALAAKTARLDEVCRQFSERLRELFEAGTVDLAPEEIQSFVRQVKGCLKKVIGIFSG
jgi:hypothetical protein